ncbi:MAG: NYN domain-containing protein, partial [Actinomycetota bacterium]|nr:NYN domain-containing protein [Actinomycetota bacterium]
MASYLILDGYNLIGALDRYGTRTTGSLDASRELLINDALKATGWTGRQIILVFDAYGSPEPQRSELRAGGA